MECSCIVSTYIDHDEAINVSLKHLKAIEPIKCSECRKTIEPGEEYVFESEYHCYEDPADKFYEFSTCLDCKSIRDNFFEDWTYEQILEDLEDHIEQAETVDESCIARLTPRARGIVCEIIEDIWARHGG